MAGTADGGGSSASNSGAGAQAPGWGGLGWPCLRPPPAREPGCVPATSAPTSLHGW